MSHALTYAQAAAILECHLSNVAKLVAKGQLTSRGQVRDGALDRPEVEALAERRAAKRAAKTTRSPRKYQRVDHRPDHELPAPAVAAAAPSSSSAATHRFSEDRNRGSTALAEHQSR